MRAKIGLIRWLSNPALSDILNPSGQKCTVVVDFSSPNVAKPFHLGHFRATIVGNFIRNINETAGHRVIGINYLGDWGSQFDLLTQGWMKYGSEAELRTDPLRYLNKIYVQINTELSAARKTGTGQIGATATKLGPNVRETADNLRVIVKELTEQHLRQTYARMNVQFTDYEYESDYVDGAQSVVNGLLSRGLAVKDSTGATCIPADLLAPGSPNIVLLKSDGNSLYLSRDLAAAVSRYERYRFDRIHYVVEIGQQVHFENLRSILRLMNYPWADLPTPRPGEQLSTHDQWHIPFGRVHGASTRRGQGLFLDEILDNAKQTIQQRMNQSPNTRVSHSHTDGILDASHVADHLGVSCLVLQMLRVVRQKPLELPYFLGQPLQSTTVETIPVDMMGLSGVAVQYAHARLCSLERRLLHSTKSISEQDSIGLVHDLVYRLDRSVVPPASTESNLSFYSVVDHLDKFPEVLRASYTDYEPYLLVHYMFRLVTLTNSAWTQLPVMRCESEDDKLWRISLFLASRNVLALCLRLLGLHPLNAM